MWRPAAPHASPSRSISPSSTRRILSLPLDASGFTTQEVLATTPRIPGLVVTIPQGTKITGPNGNPVSQITITPVPPDRSPMPFPAGVTAPA